MDAAHFDHLACRMTSGVNRRRVVSAIVAGAAGYVAFAPESEAKKRRKKRLFRKKKRQWKRNKDGWIGAGEKDRLRHFQ